MNLPAICSFVRAHRWSLTSGALVGVAITAGISRLLFNFAPFFSESSSAWSTPLPAGARTAQGLYQPRVDDLLQRVRENGRAGGAAWQSLREASQAWLLADPIGCLNHLSQTGATALVDEAFLDDALEKASSGQFPLALKLADELQSAALRTRWITRAFAKEIERNPESALLALNAVPTALRFNLGFNLALKWAAKDPVKAIRGAITHNPMFIQSMAYQWAGNDPEAAFHFFADAPEPIEWARGQRIARQEIIGLIAQRHPQKALELLRGIPDNTQRSNTTLNALKNIALDDPRLALELARGLRGDLEKLKALSAIGDQVARTNPAMAAEIREELPGERSRLAADARSIWKGGYEKPAESAQKAVALSNPIARSDAMHSAADVWLGKQSQEMLDFVTEQATKEGNVSWMRVLVDNVLDHAEAGNYGAELSPKIIAKLSPEARASIVKEIATRPASEGRERLLQTLK